MRSMVLRAGMVKPGGLMPPNRSFEKELAHIESMSDRLPEIEDIGRLRKVLGNANNYLVAKAAKLVEDQAIVALLPEVLEAYERFFEDAVATDPQCWAKNALVKTLVRLECRDAAVYIRGLRHTQEEPVWGGQSDTAGALRGTCVLALVACDGLTQLQLFELMLDSFVDADKTVRMEAARALGHVGGMSAYLLLRLRILVGKEEPEVLGACFSALLGMEGGDRTASIKLVARFLEDGEEAAGEAAFSLAETHDADALETLLERRRKDSDPWFGSVLDQAIVLTRLPAGMDFLLAVVENNPSQAASALEAISRVHHSDEVRMLVASAVRRAESDRVRVAFRQFFPEEVVQE